MTGRMTHWLACAAVVLLTWTLLGCGDDGTARESDALVDTLLALSIEEGELDCMCFPDPQNCPQAQPTQAEVDCVKSVVAAHADEFAPELKCQIREREHENGCLMQSCDATEFLSCTDAFAEDCDDTVAETYEDELDTCAPPQG